MKSHTSTPLDFANAATSSPHSHTPTSAHQYHHRPTSSAMSGALQHASGNEGRPSTAMSIGSGYRFGQRDSISAAQPISMQSTSGQAKPRRESLAGSMVTGMSWGGASVGSWIRDDIIMQGTSPFPYQSPSFHSSSYQPKLEADFMRDFSCCGLTLPTLHDLMEHYEEVHTGQMEELQKRASNEGPAPDPKAAIANSAAAALKDPNQVQQQQPHRSAAGQRPASMTPQRSGTPTAMQQPVQHVQAKHQRQQPSTSQEEETVGRMEMDEDFAAQAAAAAAAMTGQYPMHPQQQNQSHKLMQQAQFSQHNSPRSPIDMVAANGSNPLLQHQGLRISTPNTPTSSHRSTPFFHNNPTVSSVNTPTLTAHPGVQAAQQQQQAYFTPNSSAPGTPAELDPDFVGNLGQMNVGYMQGGHLGGGFGNWGYTSNADMLDLCIDEPAKRLFTTSGSPFNATSSPQQQHAQLHQPPPTTAPGASALQLGDGQYTENSELARTIREQQKLAGVPDPSADGIPKPFHCPVIGCEKAYKNQNGLKYHKAHGHNTQTLHANPNGTFSIVDPETLKPFPGTLGMEKHKPYQCQTCGKRYKNLNGLKYHKAHSPTCDPEIKGLNSATNSKRNSLELKQQQAPTSSPHGSQMPLPQGYQQGLMVPAGDEEPDTDDEDLDRSRNAGGLINHRLLINQLGPRDEMVL